MFGYKHYVPILKGKMGEFKALSHLRLRPSIYAKLTPFFDIPRPENQWKSRFDEYLAKKAVYIQKNWGAIGTIFVDLFDIQLTLRTSYGQHYVQFLFDELRNCNVLAVPVTGLDRDDDYNLSIANVIATDRRGVCIRLLKDDIENPTDAEMNVGDLLSDLKVKPKDTHLILDFRQLLQSDISQRIDDTVVFLENFGNLRKWNTLTIAGSGFPQHMGGVDKNSSKLIPRTELDLWEQVLIEGKRRNCNRYPTFGDYGISHPDILDFDLSFNPSAKIRYTLPRNWLVIKGGGLKRKINGRMSRDHSQFYTLASRLCRNNEYFGRDYSYGDFYIFNCAQHLIGPGHLPKWIEVDTNHHLTLVAQQIANSRVI